MAPYEISSWGPWAEPVIHVMLGTAFGFVLERAGFGSAKKLTNQFYLNDMTVLKVMFTAIITAMVLILAATTFGLLDFERLWVNPTYLGSGIVGGLLFGVGFVVGGYCPGTALVAAATLKLDGLLFTLGVLGGILAFGYSEPLIDAFWNDFGNYGRLTLFDWMGLPMPVVVLMAVVMAVVFFAGGEWVERLMRPKSEPKASPSRRWRIAHAYAGALVALSASMVLSWHPTEPLRRGAKLTRIETSIRNQQIQIDPRELADLMRDKRVALSILDCRDEFSFNRFHLLDAQRINPTAPTFVSLPSPVIKVILAADEPSALQAYRTLSLRNVENLYVLAGGMPAWSELFDAQGCSHRQAALGGNHPQSRPPLLQDPVGATYVPKVKRSGMGAKKAGGGCGG